jgi:uncharacterized protein (DUF1697 family)
MASYVAFLGGINVGGHRVTMDRLRGEFESLGFDDVSTFIASGNVLFRATGSAAPLEARIEAHLEDALGYTVPTFLRTRAAVVACAALTPFGGVASGHTHVVAFLKKTPGRAAGTAALALANDHDRFALSGKDLHWYIRSGFSDSTIKASALRSALGQPYTVRNVKSLRTLAARL